MRTLSLLPFFVLVFFVGGCQTTQSNHVQVKPHFLDQSFAGFEQVEVESQQEIFQLGTDAKQFVDSLKTGAQHFNDTSDLITDLVTAIFDRSDFNLIYDNGANTTASETFANRAANCLSLSIMTYAMAKEAGLGVKFREIDIPEYWTRKNGFSLINGHINLRLRELQEHDSSILFDDRTMVLDFDPFSPKKYFPSKPATKARVLAMFYNNKGADALLKKQHTDAYAYFRSAILTDRNFQDAWTNLGILYRMTGHYDGAELIYKEALKLDEDNLTLWENLAILHQHQGHEQKADEILSMVSRKRMSNPYYHYILGEQELESGNYQQALNHYEKAVSIDRTHHEFYFGLAKAHAQLGDMDKAIRYLRRAKRNTNIEDLKDHYQHKMDLFARL